METETPEELRLSEKRALQELKTRLEEAILSDCLISPSPRRRTHVMNPWFGGLCPVNCTADISLWGVPLLPSKRHEGTDAVLLKFLKAREFKACEALEMLRRTLRWRRDFGIDGILDEAMGPTEELERLAYMDGVDREGHPLCYNMYGVMRDRCVLMSAFGTEWERFLRWRVQFMEMGIRKLRFGRGGVGSVVQIIDLKNSALLGVSELEAATKKVLAILQDNYPELVTRSIFINVSFRYYVYHALLSRLLSQRTRSKFVFARPSKVQETLLKFIAPENVPVRYGGLRRKDDDEFSEPEGGSVSKVTVRGMAVETIEIPIVKAGVTAVWDLIVVGWDVNYKEEFTPDDECSYSILIQEEKKLEESVRNSFHFNEPGKINLTIDNRSSLKKKTIFYRYKIRKTKIPHFL
ncbi:Patellin-4 [Acorus gramineus]|uniref:Patellin-4 n=1 Tax=Acorus gramineus TaxID=55184 RepID=A0AAV9ARW7_ACOGR|nr:Patellin-4 [Acorus gramineus]